MRFSQRIGVDPVSDVIQTEGMSGALRNSLWNVLDQCIWSKETFLRNRYGNGLGFVDGFSRDLWFNFFKLPIDSRPEYGFQILDQIRKYFFSCEWFHVYDFIEFVVQNYTVLGLVELVNEVLERELSGFRLMEGMFTPVSDASEREAIEKRIGSGTVCRRARAPSPSTPTFGEPRSAGLPQLNQGIHLGHRKCGLRTNRQSKSDAWRWLEGS